MGIRAGTVFHGTVGQPTAQVIDGSLKVNDNGGADQFLTRTASSGNRRTWTWSAWLKRQQLVDKQTFMFAETDSNNQTSFGFNHSGASPASGFYFRSEISGTTVNADLSAVLRDCSSFYHIVVSCDTTKKAANERVKVWINGKHQTWDTSPGMSENADLQINHNVQQQLFAQGGVGDLDAFVSQVYLIDGLQLGPEYFGFIDPLTNTWRPKKFRAVGTTVNDGTDWSANFSGNGGTQPSTAFDGDGPRQDGYVHSGSALTVNFSPPLSGHIIVYGGTGAGSHNSTTTDTFTLSDGSVLSSQEKYDVAPYWSVLDFGEKKNITSLVCSAGYTLYAVEVDGVYLKDSTTETLDFGTNGFYLPMENQDDFEIDKSGKGNNWTKSGFSGTSIDPDVVKDSPSGAVFGGRAQTGITTTSSAPANYATLNPLFAGSDQLVLSDGNLTATAAGTNSAGNWKGVVSTLGATSGKWYAEFLIVALGGSNHANIGISPIPKQTTPLQSQSDGGHFYNVNGGAWNASSESSSVHTAAVVGDTIGVTVDFDASQIKWYLNGVLDYTVTLNNNIINNGFVFALANYTTSTVTSNFGQKPFKYAPPQGFLPFNSASLRPETVITRPDQYVGVTTYTGNNTVGRIIDIGRNADLVWVKKRTAENHILVDTVRGANNFLMSDATNTANTSGGPITGIGATVYNGFIVDNNGYVNGSDSPYVCWNWKAGGSKNTFNVDDVGYASAAAAGLTAGTLTISGASVGTKQGFSIIKYAGSASDSTFPHGLTQAPDFYIIKCLDVGAEQWRVYHSSLGADYALTLNTTAEKSDSNLYFNDTEPTSTVASVYAGYDGVNNSGRNYIAYLWHDVPGLQKFGTYEGLGGTANGSFVELGFRPAIVWVKNADTASQTNTHWCVFDRLRPGFNKSPAQNRLHLDATDQEDPDRVDDGQGIDILSNGFRVRSNNWYETNFSGATYIYCAWAEAPASNLFGGQSNAR